MAKQENLSFTGVVLEELGNSMFRVELDNMNVPAITCTISGKTRKNYINTISFGFDGEYLYIHDGSFFEYVVIITFPSPSWISPT